MAQALAAIHHANPKRLPFSLTLGSNGETSGLFLRYQPDFKHIVEDQIADAYPDAKLQRLRDSDFNPPEGSKTFVGELRLRPDIFPLKKPQEFEDRLKWAVVDPITGLLSAVKPAKNLKIASCIEIELRPAGRIRCRIAERIAKRLVSLFFSRHPFLTIVFARVLTSHHVLFRFVAHVASWLLAKRPRPHSVSESAAKDAIEKCNGTLFEACIHIIVSVSRLQDSRIKTARVKAHRKIREIAGAFGQFNPARLIGFELVRIRRVRKCIPRFPIRTSLLSTQDLSLLWHPPTELVRTEKMAVLESRQLEPPPTIPSREKEPDIAVLGRTAFRNRRDIFGIRPDDRRRHLAIIGKTGMGKSTLLERLIVSDIDAARGIALIDPHGDLADSLLMKIPKRRTNDVVLFDIGDRTYHIAFNPLSCRRPEERPLVASGVVSAFKKIFGESWGPRLEHILRNSVLALLETSGTTLLSLLRLLSDVSYQKQVVSRVCDPVVCGFWENEFAKWRSNFRAEAVAPVQNKVAAFLSNPILRGILGQPRSKLDLRCAMDGGQILIVNLSKGRIGEDASALLGALLVSSVQLAAMSRADVVEEDRPDFYLYVDEFQNFATDSFAVILSEARKYRLNLTIANQYLAQVPEETQAAVFGNVGSLLSFQVGSTDAEVLAEQFAWDVKPEDLNALPKFTAIARLLIDGMPLRPFTMETLRPTSQCSKQAQEPEVVRRTSRRRYGRRTGVIRSQIEKSFASV